MESLLYIIIIKNIFLLLRNAREFRRPLATSIRIPIRKWSKNCGEEDFLLREHYDLHLSHSFCLFVKTRLRSQARAAMGKPLPSIYCSIWTFLREKESCVVILRERKCDLNCGLRRLMTTFTEIIKSALREARVQIR